MSKAILRQDGYLEYKCPACGSHAIPVMTKEKNWGWNGDRDNPTIIPSVKHFHNGYPEQEGHDSIPPFCCHYFIKNGNIEFCGDCTHDKRGQTIPLPDYTGEQQ